MITGSVARRYAKALLAIGIETKNHERFGQDLAPFAALMDNKDLRDTLQNPSQPLSRRKAILEELITRIKPSKTVWNFMLLLADRNRLEHIQGIHREYHRMLDEHIGRVRATVTSAERLGAADVLRLKTALEEKTGKQVILEQNTEPDLIAGMVTQVGSIVYDGSIRTRLEQMRHTLLAGE